MSYDQKLTTRFKFKFQVQVQTQLKFKHKYKFKNDQQLTVTMTDALLSARLKNNQGFKIQKERLPIFGTPGKEQPPQHKSVKRGAITNKNTTYTNYGFFYR